MTAIPMWKEGSSKRNVITWEPIAFTVKLYIMFMDFLARFNKKNSRCIKSCVIMWSCECSINAGFVGVWRKVIFINVHVLFPRSCWCLQHHSKLSCTRCARKHLCKPQIMWSIFLVRLKTKKLLWLLVTLRVDYVAN